MSEGDSPRPQSPTEYYWTVIPKYIASVGNAISLSHRIAGTRSDSARQYWAGPMFTRLCSVAISVLHLCPGSPMDADGRHWDFSSLAPLVRSLVRTSSMLFYLSTEVVGDEESRARILVMQLGDSTERLRFFESFAGREQSVRSFEASGEEIRSKLEKNAYFEGLPVNVRNDLLSGKRASILSADEILDRMGVLDQQGRALLSFISSHADVSPLAYYRTGEGNRGRGEENDIDKHYIATAVAIADEFLVRATADVGTLFRDTLASKSEKQLGGARDERFEIAFNYVKSWQGADIEELVEGDDSGAPLICSDCFHDEGLRLAAAQIGQRNLSCCVKCGSQTGVKLSKRRLAILAQQFFVRGTIRRPEYGGYPAVQFNTQQPTSIRVAPWLEPDLRLIEGALHVGFFHYNPRLWMVGEVEPLKTLQKTDSRATVISRILDEYPGRILDADEQFYRLRKAPLHPENFDEYDPPPAERLGGGRLDTPQLPILYGSQDLEVCLHECRVAAEDEVYVATLAPLRRLRLPNLAEALTEEGVTEFESLDMAVHMLFLAGRHSYEVTRAIACAAQKAGFDGLVYPSYFTLLRTGEMPFETTLGLSHRRFPGFPEHARKNTISNLALFGRPIADGSVQVRCIDRVMLSKVDYRLNFGPLFEEGSSSAQRERWARLLVSEE